MNDREVLKLCKEWFAEIAERCDKLISGNVSHNGRMEDCPYRKEHYPEHKHKRKQTKGMNYLFD